VLGDASVVLYALCGFGWRFYALLGASFVLGNIGLYGSLTVFSKSFSAIIFET
jgi:hypothetical protein